MVLKQDKEFNKIVKFHDQMIKSLISQKARGDQSFNDQTEEIRATLAIPSNKFLDWAKSLDMFIKTVINSKINDMELLNKYKEFVKELIEYQSQNDDIAQKLQEFNQDYDMLTNIVIKLENKIAQIKNSTGMVDEKIIKLQEQLRDAQETISTQADRIEELENELEEERRNKRKTTTREKVEEEDYEDTSDADDVYAEDETEQAWNNILGDEPVKKKHDDEEQDDDEDDDDDESDDDEDDTMEENTNDEQEEDASNDEDDDDPKEIKKGEEDKKKNEKEINSEEESELELEKKHSSVPVIEPKFQVHRFKKKPKKKYKGTTAFVYDVISARKDIAYNIQHIYNKYVESPLYKTSPLQPNSFIHHLKKLVNSADIYQFSPDPKSPVYKIDCAYSLSLNPINLDKNYELSVNSKKAMKKKEKN